MASLRDEWLNLEEYRRVNQDIIIFLT